MLAEVVVVVAVVASMLAIGKKVGVIVKQITLRPYILLQVGVLIGEEVSVKKKSVVIQAEIV